MRSAIKEENKEFNGYIYIDKKVEVGRYAILDADFATGGGKVYVHALNTIFATVSMRPDSSTWSVTRGRLSAVEEQ